MNKIIGPVFPAYEQLFLNTKLADYKELLAKCNLNDYIMPNLTYDKERTETSREDLLTGILHNRLGRMVVRACEIPLGQGLTSISWKQLLRVVETCHDFGLTVQGTMGMDQAQVTAGGIVTQEFDPNTLQSRIVPELYAAGEVLDVDGDCGGYNLQWAWSSGLLAGQLRESEPRRS